MSRHGPLLGILVDLGLPVAVYAACRAFGATPLVALLAGGGAATAWVVVVALARRRLDAVAALVAATFAVLVVAWSLTGDEHLLLVRESVVSGSLGLLLLGSCAVGRPVTAALVRRMHADDATALAAWELRWREDPALRRRLSTLAAVWGTGLLAEALVRVPLVLLAPADLAYPLSILLGLLTVGGLLAWTVRSGRRTSTTPAAPTAPTAVG